MILEIFFNTHIVLNRIKERKMDYRKLLKDVKNKKDLKITLKKTEEKGVGVFATQTIKKGETVAFYKIKIYREKDYESPTDSVYTFEVPRKNGEIYKRLIGDIYEGSFPLPEENIPFWGPFINEPSGNQRINTYIDFDLVRNYKDRTYSQPGDTIIYRFIATKMIRKGEEVLWYYGDKYPRNYKVKNKN